LSIWLPKVKQSTFGSSEEQDVKETIFHKFIPVKSHLSPSLFFIISAALTRKFENYNDVSNSSL